jgi:hypothetical protein
MRRGLCDSCLGPAPADKSRREKGWERTESTPVDDDMQIETLGAAHAVSPDDSMWVVAGWECEQQ